MDRNQVTGMVLISAIFIIYLMYFGPKEGQNTENNTQNTTQTDSSAQQSDNSPESVAIAQEEIPDSIKSQQKFKEFGVFSAAVNDNESLTEVNSGNLTLKFSAKGGRLIEANLNNYETFEKKPLLLVDETNFKSDINLQRNSGKRFSLNDLSFITEGIKENNGLKEISFKAELGGGKGIIRTYTIDDKIYKISQNIKFVGVANDIAANSVMLNLKQGAKRLEKGLSESQRKTWINYYNEDEDEFDDLTARSNEEDSEEIEDIKWFSFKQSFFSVGLIADSKFEKVKIAGSMDKENKAIIASFKASLALPYAELTSPAGYNYSYYLGPNQKDILLEVCPEFDKNVDFGWPILRDINEYAIYPLFRLLEKTTNNYGIIILILVLVIKGLLLPLTYKSQMGMAKMKVLKPEVDALNEKFADDKQKAQIETMNLYKQFGVSPMSGCIPMLLQMPVLFAMFRLFPNLIELRHKAFLWADDLSSYDELITWTGGDFFPLSFMDGHISLFTLLMTGSTIIYTMFSNQFATQTQPGMKTMSYMMPLVFFFVLNSYSSGLTYYYFLSNLFGIAQQIIIKRFVDDDKIREKLEANKVKNSNQNKSSFQNTLANALKKQQEKQQEKQQQKNKKRK